MPEMASSSSHPASSKTPSEHAHATEEDDQILAEEEQTPIEIIHVTDKGIPGEGPPSSRTSDLRPSRDGLGHGPVEYVNSDDADIQQTHPPVASAQPDPATRSLRAILASKRKGWLTYVKTKEFWIVVLLGQVLSLCITSTNTFTSLLQQEHWSSPAFQTLFNYALLNLIYTPYTFYRYGPKGYWTLLRTKGWRYLILGFLDACGNYFIVLAYQYTSILSAQLINFFAIVVVVVISLLFLGVRYRITQYVGILICIGGMGILLASDYINGSDISNATDQLKGDLFALAGATFYGLSNVLEEFLVSKAPLYEVIGQLAFWAMPVMAVIGAIFDRDNIASAVWNGKVGGYLTGYTLILSMFYSLAPILFRLSSAAFFNISLLTANFWGVLIGTKVLGIPVHWMYPIAFVLILVGLGIYFLTEGIMGEAVKPWLGANQEHGVDGVGTAKGRVEVRRRRANDADTTPGNAGIAV